MLLICFCPFNIIDNFSLNSKWNFIGYLRLILQGELGANAILAVSMAACRAGAAEKEVCENPMFTLLFSLKLNLSNI